MSDFRSAVGSLQWLSGQTRPDLAAASSLCQKGSKTEISDLTSVRVHQARQRNTRLWHRLPFCAIQPELRHPDLLRRFMGERIKFDFAVWRFGDDMSTTGDRAYVQCISG